jgi:glycerophosphoryl diester phosphodiesterase
MEILGHRGAPSEQTPENTLASVEAAFAAGADGVEVDVRLTADDVPVCCHDVGLSRVAGVHRGLRALTFAELAAVRVAGHAMPSVGTVAAAMPADRTLVLDLKPEQRPHRLMTAVLTALENLPAAATAGERVILSSGDARVLDMCARLAPSLPRAIIVGDAEPFSVALGAALRRGDRALHIPLRTVFGTPELVQVAHGHGLTVRAWTVNRVVDARLLNVLGLDGVITDVPGALRAGLRARPTLLAAE